MQRLLAIILTLFTTITIATANPIDSAISHSKVNKSAISICVRNVNTGSIVYSKNDKKPMIPASTLKAVTYPVSLNELGEDYEFTTGLYKNTNNELVLKLGADPFFTSLDLKNLFRTAKSKNILEPKSINIDATVIDDVEWGEGWQWDDDLNPLMPKFSAYNIDSNLLTIVVIPNQAGTPATIKTKIFYPVTFMNLVISDNNLNSIKISRNNSISPDILTLEGTVANHTEMLVPVNYPKRYFILRLEDAIRNVKIGYYNQFSNVKMQKDNIYLVDEIKNPIDKATVEVMQKSNNMVAETVFKLAGGHYSNSTGTVQSAVKMFKDYCSEHNIATDDIRIVDGSGVSKNNLVTANFMTDFLVKQSHLSQSYKESFATAGKGTMKNRMLYFKDKIYAKTGTLSDVSAIAGFITTMSGKTYAFDIMINDAKSTSSDKKMLEEYILRAINTSY